MTPPRSSVSLGVAAMLLTATGCSFAPHYVRPGMPVPDRFPQLSESTVSVARLGWHDFFREARLQTLIEAALANNRDIRIASARVEEARAAWRIDGASLYPQIDAIGTGTRGRTLYNLPGSGAQMIETRQISAQLNTSWEIDFWGRLRNLRDAARWQYLATEEARRAVATDLIAQVANGYLLACEYTDRIALAHKSIDTREEALRILRRRYEVGSGSRLDMAQAETLLAQAQIALLQLEQEREVNQNALALLIGKQPGNAPSTLNMAELAPHVAIPAGIPSDLLRNRPDIVAAENRLRAADANIGAARAAFFPNINLTGSYGTASGALDGLFSGGSEVWNFTPSISVPLFNAGRLKGNLDVAKARRDLAVAEYEKAIQSAFRDVSDALVRRRLLALQIDTTAKLLDAQRERARLAQLRFENGRSAYLEVLDAQRDLFDAEQGLIQLRRAEMASAVALYAALGGGFAADTNFNTGPRQESKEQR